MTVPRQLPSGQNSALSNGGFLVHRNPQESEDVPEILCPTHSGASRKAGA
jgi:hypothetical protein